MKAEEEEPAPRTSRSAGEAKKKKSRKKTHAHIGPNARAYRAGRAFCPSCDAEKGLRLTGAEREAEKVGPPKEQRFERTIRGSHSRGRDS